MTTFQRIIQYIAMGFAGLLALLIIGFITATIFSFLSISNLFYNSNNDINNYSKEFKNITSLDIDTGATNFYIKQGDRFKVEAKNVSKSFRVSVSGNDNLKIRNYTKNTDLFFNNKINKNSEITVFLPEGFTAEFVKLTCGAGNIQIDFLNTNEITINAGAGNINANNINAEYLNLNGGVGNIYFTDSVFNGSSINSGVGNFSFEGILYGPNKIDCGVGNVTLKINSDFNNYDMSVSSGLGKVLINGQRHTDFNSNNGKNNLIRIDGGVGNVIINFDKFSF